MLFLVSFRLKLPLRNFLYLPYVYFGWIYRTLNIYFTAYMDVINVISLHKSLSI